MIITTIFLSSESIIIAPQVKVSLLNFTITIKGLEEQLLNTAVKEELPDLAQKKVRRTNVNESEIYAEVRKIYILSTTYFPGNLPFSTVLHPSLN